MSRVVAIVPAYNEAQAVAPVVRGAREYVDRVVVVDDGSGDDTADLARAAGATVIERAENGGIGAALRTGYEWALDREFDVVVQLDGDGQHDPHHIPDLLGAVESGDVAIGARSGTGCFRHYSTLRVVGILGYSAVANLLTGAGVTDVTSGFRAYDADCLPKIIHRGDGHWAVEQTIETGLRGLEIVETPTPMAAPDPDNSQFSTRTFVLYPLRMLVSIATAIGRARWRGRDG